MPKEYEFELIFKISDSLEPKDYLDALYEAGCSDAMVGMGKHGAISLSFIREANSATDAVLSAVQDTKKAIPSAQIMSASPILPRY